jgi:hypothetical protein
MNFETMMACVILSAFAGVCLYVLIHVIKLEMNK